MIVFQLLGGGVGGFIARMGFDVRNVNKEASVFPPFYYLCGGPRDDTSTPANCSENELSQTFLVELIATFIFVSVCLNFKGFLKP